MNVIERVQMNGVRRRDVQRRRTHLGNQLLSRFVIVRGVADRLGAKRTDKAQAQNIPPCGPTRRHHR